MLENRHFFDINVFITHILRALHPDLIFDGLIGIIARMVQSREAAARDAMVRGITDLVLKCKEGYPMLRSINMEFVDLARRYLYGADLPSFREILKGVGYTIRVPGTDYWMAIKYQGRRGLRVIMHTFFGEVEFSETKYISLNAL